MTQSRRYFETNDYDIAVYNQGIPDNNQLDDGLHPNSEGDRKIFEKVKGFLVLKKII